MEGRLMEYYSPFEKAFKKITTPFEHFIHAQTTTGLILIVVTVIALIIANTSLYETYNHIIHAVIEFNVGEWKLSHSLHHWINDGLMTVFFFMVGLEIKREILVGELSSFKAAILPIIAAIGGMVFPALIYLGINYGEAGQNGWGIPMATDIAFAITALVLLGNRVSPALVTFLTALAIVDDLGAVLVIAVFYTNEIQMVALGLAALSFVLLILFNLFGIRTILPYILVGLFFWFFMLESGVHATIAGVLTAFTIPFKPKIRTTSFVRRIRKLLDQYDGYHVEKSRVMNENQKAILQNIKDNINAVSSPAEIWEHVLHLPVGLIVIPIFALANAAIYIDFSSISDQLTGMISLGIIFGLIVGKIMGVFGVSYLAVKFKIAQLPHGATFSQLFGVAALAGIGFTMSIFVADLAFLGNDACILQAKIAILTASLISGFFGYIWLRFIAQKR